MCVCVFQRDNEVQVSRLNLTCLCKCGMWFCQSPVMATAIWIIPRITVKARCRARMQSCRSLTMSWLRNVRPQMVVKSICFVVESFSMPRDLIFFLVKCCRFNICFLQNGAQEAVTWPLKFEDWKTQRAQKGMGDVMILEVRVYEFSLRPL